MVLSCKASFVICTCCSLQRMYYSPIASPKPHDSLYSEKVDELYTISSTSVNEMKGRIPADYDGMRKPFRWRYNSPGEGLVVASRLLTDFHSCH